MGSGLKKKAAEQMLPILRNKEQEKAWRWGLKNKVYISPFAASNTEWWIDINVNGKEVRSPKKYSGKEIWLKIYELYIYYFNKYNTK